MLTEQSLFEKNGVPISALREKWDSIIEHKGSPKIRDRFRKNVVAVMLENQQQWNKENGLLAEAAPANQSGAFPNATNLKGYDPVLISLVRRAAPAMIPFDIAGVQPMTGPTGLIFALYAKYTSQGGTEALFNEPDTDFSGTGTQTGTTPAGQTSAGSYTTGTGMSTATGEALGTSGGGSWAEMAFSIDKITVTAITRKLKAEYTLELSQDMQAVHGLDADATLTDILAQELNAEINREFIRTIYNNAKFGAQVNVQNAGTFDCNTDADGRWSEERHKGLVTQIKRDQNAILLDVRRGRGNFVIASADVVTAISNVIDLKLPEGQGEFDGDGPIQSTFVGSAPGIGKVFVDPFLPQGSSDFYLTGYRGSNPLDAGIFYAPYIPLQLVRATDENAFFPKVGFMTRYGIKAHPHATSAGDGALTYNTNGYFRKVTVANLMVSTA